MSAEVLLEVRDLCAWYGDAQILFRVTEVFEPASAGPETVAQETRQSLSQGLADDLLDQLVSQLQSKYEVRINQSAINQALSF